MAEMRLLIFFCLAATASAREAASRKSNVPALNFGISNCLKEYRARELVKTGFSQLFPLHLREVDGALPSRFFANTLTFTRSGLDNAGHFLDVRCLESSGFQRPCEAERDILEERIFFFTVLKSLPCDFTGRKLYSESSWEIASSGKAVLTELKFAYPRLWKDLISLMTKALGKKR